MSKKKTPAGKIDAPARTDYEKLRANLGVELGDAEMIHALTHRSWSFENDEPNNERLEFLGDAVLELVITDELFTRHPDLPEKDLSRMRIGVVSQPPMAQMARRVQIDSFVRLGRGEIVTHGRSKDSILCDTAEAIIGATYLACGLAETRAMILRLLRPEIEYVSQAGEALDWKTSLQTLVAQLAPGKEIVYTDSYEGPDHARRYQAVVSVANLVTAKGEGTSKRAAQIRAAEKAYRALHPQVGGVPAAHSQEGGAPAATRM